MTVAPILILKKKNWKC